MGFPGGSAVKNPPANAGDACLIPGLERSPDLGNEHRSPSLQGDSLPFKSQTEAQLLAHFSLNGDSFGGRTDTAEGQEAIAQL